MRNRISVAFDWIWAYLTLRNGTRLITGGSHREDSCAMVGAEVIDLSMRVQHG
jgi:hypothetical protein